MLAKYTEHSVSFMSADFHLEVVAGAEPDRVKREIEEVVGIDCSNAIMVSAKQVDYIIRMNRMLKVP